MKYRMNISNSLMQTYYCPYIIAGLSGIPDNSGLSVSKNPPKDIFAQHGQIIAEFIRAERTKELSPAKYELAANKLFSLYAKEYQQLKDEKAMGTIDRLKTLTALFEIETLTAANFTPEEIKKRTNYIPYRIAKGSGTASFQLLAKVEQIEITPSGLPEDTLQALASIDKEPGYSYLKFVEDNLSSMFFVRNIPSSKSLPANTRAAAINISGTAIVGTGFFDGNNRRSNIELSRLLIHEAGHNEAFNKNINFGSDRSKAEFAREAYAEKASQDFLNKYLKN